MAQLDLHRSEEIMQKFVSSSAKFRIVQQVGNDHGDEIRTLFILDSSYNPPSLAHASLALTALKRTNYIKEDRLLLLFSTSNADKAPKPASFPHRLSMMSLFAKGLISSLNNDESRSNHSPISIDIGLTTAAYYTDKSTAISDSNEYSGNPRHVHLMGYDTLIRFLAPKYYAKFDPPLSALKPYFDGGHSVQVLLRLAEGNGPDMMSQISYLEEVRNGSLAKEGFKKEWANQIELLENEEAGSISSTSARDAAAHKDWETLAKQVPYEIMLWIQSNQLYQN